jgi:hypothetical protein
VNDFVELEILLSRPLDTDNPVALMQQLSEVEAWQVKVSAAYRNRKAILAEAKHINYPAKDKDLYSSAEARLFAVEAATATTQADVDKLGDMAEIIQKRISLGQTILANMRQEVKSGVRMV